MHYKLEKEKKRGKKKKKKKNGIGIETVSFIGFFCDHVYFVFTGIESVYQWQGEVWTAFPH